eukprot:gene12791-biopygen7780
MNGISERPVRICSQGGLGDPPREGCMTGLCKVMASGKARATTTTPTPPPRLDFAHVPGHKRPRGPARRLRRPDRKRRERGAGGGGGDPGVGSTAAAAAPPPPRGAEMGVERGTGEGEGRAAAAGR